MTEDSNVGKIAKKSAQNIINPETDDSGGGYGGFSIKIFSSGSGNVYFENSFKTKEYRIQNNSNNHIEEQTISNSTPTSTPSTSSTIFQCNNPKNCITLKNCLETLKTPINEEQAWALIYQFISLYRNIIISGGRQIFTDNEIPNGIEQLSLHRDGSVHCTLSKVNLRKSISCRDLQHETQKQQFHKDMERLKCAYNYDEIIASHEKILHNLAVIIYTALDYNLPQSEQCNLSQELEDLITHMTADDEDQDDDEDENDDDHQHNIDEVIDELKKNSNHTKIFDYVLENCRNHIKSIVAEDHYRAVCCTLVNEIIELRIFLQHTSFIDKETNSLQSRLNSDASKQKLAKFGFIDWARFWVQVINELRKGVHLRKANYERKPLEFQLTPYEILMNDIRSKKYQLKRVIIKDNLPTVTKKDAHAVLMEFIRSRPQLKKATERQLAPPIKEKLTPHELLLDSIRKGQPLKHIQPPASPRLKDRLSTTSIVPMSLQQQQQQQQKTTQSTENESSIVAIPNNTKQKFIKMDFSLLHDDKKKFFDTIELSKTANAKTICSQPKKLSNPIGVYRTTPNNIPTSGSNSTATTSQQLQSTLTTRRKTQGSIMI